MDMVNKKKIHFLVLHLMVFVKDTTSNKYQTCKIGEEKCEEALNID
jgi:hypothetical protein